MKEELTERRYKRNMPFLEKVENAINRMIFDPLIDAIMPEDEATETPEPPEPTPDASASPPVRSEPPDPRGSSPDAGAVNTGTSQADQGSDGGSGGGGEGGSGG